MFDEGGAGHERQKSYAYSPAVPSDFNFIETFAPLPTPPSRFMIWFALPYKTDGISCHFQLEQVFMRGGNELPDVHAVDSEARC